MTTLPLETQDPLLLFARRMNRIHLCEAIEDATAKFNEMQAARTRKPKLLAQLVDRYVQDRMEDKEVRDEED
jgi:hypothetical protein